MVNPSITFLNSEGTTISTVSSTTISDNGFNGLNALVLPDENGLYVARLFGSIDFEANSSIYKNPATSCIINVPAVKIATRQLAMSTFLAPQYIGLNGVDGFTDTAISSSTHCTGACNIGLSEYVRYDVSLAPSAYCIEQNTSNLCSILVLLAGATQVLYDANDYGIPVRIFF